MSIIVEQRFISYISSSLDRFKWVVPSEVANFRCNICGDSEKNKHKARGYFYVVKKSDMFCFKCQNCAASMSFRKYIKQCFPHYSKELRLEEFQFARSFSSEPRSPQHTTKIDHTSTSVHVKLDEDQKLLTPLDQLEEDHVAVAYCKSRNIPKSKYNKLYYTKNYSAWIKQFLNDDKKYPEDARLVMLMKDRDGNIFGAQGRALTKTSIRYVTVKFDKDRPKIFGLDVVDVNLPIFVVEGVIDSMFIPNCIAICGGDIGSSIDAVGVKDYNKFIVVLDNEPRSADTVRRMQAAIEKGCRICVWDVDPALKDINEMVNSGMKPRDILVRICHNVFHGAKAIAKLKHWKKI